MLELYLQYLRGLNWLLKTAVGVIVVALSFIIPILVILFLMWLVAGGFTIIIGG